MAESNAKLAAIFREMAQITELLGGNRFRVNAFERAARAMEDMSQDVSKLDESALKEIAGIGEGTAKRIVEYLKTGSMREHDELVAQVPAGVLRLLAVPNLGPKSVATLWKQGGVTDVATLKSKLTSGELENLPRMGRKTLENIQKNLAFVEASGKRVRIGQALPLAQWLLGELRGLKAVREAAYAGSLRRGQETVGDIDLLVSAEPGDAVAISEAFVKLDAVAQVLMTGETKTSVRTRDDAGAVQVDLRIVEPAAYGAALLYFTGSKEHNIRLRERAIGRKRKLSEYGLFTQGGKRVAGRTEQDVYEALGLAYIPPELRQDRGEIALAERGALPRLVEIGDIASELHAHTTASDGRWTIRELAATAAERGFHTIAITDHSRGQVQANGLSVERLVEHIEQVRQVAKAMQGKIAVLAGAEVDILSDGRLDYPDSVLRELDIVVASPHAALGQDSGKATRRLLKAMENRYVTIVGHPTGRMVGRRRGLTPDLKQLIAGAKERGIALEVNANHHRLDLRDTHARAAVEAGVKLSINTDAHGPADLDQLIYGVLTARRAGAQKSDVINCMGRDELSKWIESTRR